MWRTDSDSSIKDPANIYSHTQIPQVINKWKDVSTKKGKAEGRNDIEN